MRLTPRLSHRAMLVQRAAGMGGPSGERAVVLARAGDDLAGGDRCLHLRQQLVDLQRAGHRRMQRHQEAGRRTGLRRRAQPAIGVQAAHNPADDLAQRDAGIGVARPLQRESFQDAGDSDGGAIGDVLDVLDVLAVAGRGGGQGSPLRRQRHHRRRDFLHRSGRGDATGHRR
jgi:hypothetical protein